MKSRREGRREKGKEEVRAGIGEKLRVHSLEIQSSTELCESNRLVQKQVTRVEAVLEKK